MIFQNAQTLFGRGSSEDRGTAVVEGLIEQRSGLRIGRDEQHDRRMHVVLASPRTTKQNAEKVCQQRSGYAQRFNVPKRRPRLFARRGWAGNKRGIFEHPANCWEQPTPLPAKKKGGSKGHL